jgi:hypothetical protein
MRSMTGLVLAGLLLVAAAAPAQPPGGGRARTEDVDSFVARMMAFDKNKDGKLTRDEITDARLLRLFDRADTKKLGVVTKDDLAALYARENQGGAQFGGGGGPGGPGGRGGPPQPGQVLPDFLRDQLNLTEAQKKQVADFQKDVDAELAKILSAEQKARLKEMRERGPGGRSGPGGPPPQR